MGGSIAIHFRHHPEVCMIHTMYSEFQIIQKDLDEFYLTGHYDTNKIRQLQKAIDLLQLKIDNFLWETKKKEIDIVKKSEINLQCFILKDKLTKEEEKYLNNVINYSIYYNLYIPKASSIQQHQITECVN